MTINTGIQSTSGQTPEEIKEKVEGAAGEIAEKVEGRAVEMKEKARRAAGEVKEKARGAAKEVAGRVREMKQYAPSEHVVKSSLLMSGACVGAILIASALRRRHPLEAFSMMGEELPFVRSRRRRTFQTRHVLAGIGSIIGGSMILAALNRRIGRRFGDRPFVRGAMAIASAIGMDAALMGPSYFGKLVSKLGPAGTALKYGAIGSAYSLGSREEHEEAAGGYESIAAEGEAARMPPFYSGPEVGTVAGPLEHPQPLV